MLGVEEAARLGIRRWRDAEPIAVWRLGVVACVIRAREKAVRNDAGDRRGDPGDRTIHHVAVTRPATPLQNGPQSGGVDLREALDLLPGDVMVAGPTERQVGIVLPLSVVRLVACQRPIPGE